MQKILIENTQILTMTEEKVFVGDILIEGNQITAIGQINAEKKAGAEVIDGRRTVAMPGLINTHTHAAMSLLRSYADDMELMPWLNDMIWPAEAKMTDAHIYWGTQLAILEMIASGTTTFTDMYSSMHEVARAVEETGMRANLSRGLISFTDPEKKNIEENKRLYRDFHNQADGRIQVWFSPHAPYTCPPDYICHIIDAAAEFHTGLHIHVAETLDEIKQIREGYGKTPVEYLNDLGAFTQPVLAAHCVHVTEQDMEIMDEKKVAVAHNMISNLKLASGIAPVPRFLEKGIVVALGTDGASSNNSLNLFKEMPMCAFTHKERTMDPTYLKAYEVLKMATINGAKALRWEHEIGTLEVGKKADIILIDLDQPHFAPWNNVISDLVYSAQGSDVKTTIVNGKILMKDRTFIGLDAERIMFEAHKAAQAIL